MKKITFFIFLMVAFNTFAASPECEKAIDESMESYTTFVVSSRQSLPPRGSERELALQKLSQLEQTAEAKRLETSAICK